LKESKEKISIGDLVRPNLKRRIIPNK